MNVDLGSFVLELVVAGIVGGVGALLTVGMYREKVNRLEQDVGKQDGRITKLRTDTDRLLEFRVQAQKFIDSSIYRSNSPLSLSPRGQRLVNESGFRQIFETEKDHLVRMLEELGPATQYDVQEQARAMMDSLTDYEPFAPLKSYAFEKGADLGQILRAGAIMLRDYYFQKHPELVNPNEQW